MSEARRDTERASLITSGRPGGGGHPTGWMVVPLGEVIREPLRNGHSSKASSDGTGVRTLTLTAVTIGDFSEKNTKMTVADPAKVRDLWLEPGDILVERANTPELVGTARLYRGLNHYAIFPDLLIRVRLADGVLPSFVEHALSTESARSVFRQAAQGIAGSMPKIDQETVERFPLCLAPTAEQHRIVAEVEKQFTRLDAAVAGLQRVKANLKRYRASVLKAACEGRLVPTEAELARREERSFESGEELLKRILKERCALSEDDRLSSLKAAGKGPRDDSRMARNETGLQLTTGRTGSAPEGWTSCFSGDLFTFVTSGSRGWAQYYATEGPLFLRIGNLDHGSVSLDLAEVQRVSPPEGAEGQRTRVRPGDLLISITADVGMVALVPEDLPAAFINQHIALGRPVNAEIAPYMAWYLAAADGGGRQFRDLQRGATKQGLGLDDIRCVEIPLPPLPEQHRIVAEVERRLSVLDELEATIEKNLARCARLRQSILKMAFEGRLVPQDPNDEPASVLLERIRCERDASAQRPRRVSRAPRP